MAIHASLEKSVALPQRLPQGEPAALTFEDGAARLLNETLLSLAQAAKRIPPTRQGKPVHPSTLVRWILYGVRGVRLEAVRIGGRWVTSLESLERFSAALTANHTAQPGTIARPVGTAEQRRHERVEQQLNERWASSKPRK